MKGKYPLWWKIHRKASLISIGKQKDRNEVFIALRSNIRSQHLNKASAMAVLQSRLDQLEMARQAQVTAEHTQSLTEISWGNQIRSYVLHVCFRTV